MLAWLKILALFGDYDMRWPHATAKTLALAGAFNIGITLTAPEVRVGDPAAHENPIFCAVMLTIGN